MNGQNIYAQIPPFDVTSGLPANEILDLVKDENGYIWIATEKGLSRFDGYHFENFNSTSHPSIFKDNRINRIKKHGDLLYILTEEDGLILLNPEKLTLKKLSNDKPLSIAFSNDTTAFLFETGLLLVKQQNRILFKEKVTVGTKSSILIYQGDLLLSANSTDIYRINLNSPSERTKLSMKNNRSSGELMLSKTYGVVNFNKWRVFILKNNEFIEHPDFIDKIQVSFFQEEPSGSILSIDRTRTPNVMLNGKNYALVFAAEQNIQYRCICRINENTLFIGSNQGLIPVTFNPALSTRILDYPALKYNEPIVRRRIVEHKNKRYYLGFPYIFEQKEQKELGFLTDTTFSTYDGLVFNDQLFCTAEGKRTLVSLDLKTKKITSHISSENGEHGQMQGISVFSDSLLLLTGQNKITAYNPVNKRLQEFKLESGVTIYTAAQISKSDRILLGTSHGLYRIQLTSKKGFELIDQPCSSLLEIKDILFREKQNEIWLATNTGVAVVQFSDFKIKRLYGNEFEVSHPKVTALIEDLNGQIWAATYFGLTVYNTIDGTIRFVNKSQGIINQEFNYFSSCLLENGSLIFGGLNGYEIIDPNKLNDFKYSKTFTISGVEHIQTDKTKQFSNYVEGETISFRTGTESIIIHLANFDFQFKKGYTFRYTLDGNNWFEADDKGRIILSDLAYGEYTLKVQMFDPFRNLVEEKSFPIAANAPFYVKTSFHVFFAALLIGIFVLFWINFVQSLNIRTATKAKIAMDLHDESGTILTRLLFISKKATFEDKEKQQIQNGLKEALYSFRTYLDSISNKKHSLQDLSDDLKEFIATACSDSDMEFNFKMDMHRNYTLNRELYRDIKLSVYEIVTNIMKHAHANNISIECKAENKILTLSITDNGKCALSDLGTQKGNGIRNIANRAKRNKGIVKHYIKEGETGLTTEIQLPIV
jgi:ligand-binding sensor domain-containing protein/two-component sensor histidine kinase